MPVCDHRWEPIPQPEGDNEYRCAQCGVWWEHRRTEEADG